MKRTILIVFLCIVVLFFCIIIGGYFYVNLFYLPKKIVPEISKQVSTQLGRTFSLNRISINPQGQLRIYKPTLSAEESNEIFAQCSIIQVNPTYSEIYQSWKKNKNKLHVPLKIIIEDFILTPAPIKIKGQISSDLSLKIDLKNTEQIQYDGRIDLEDFNITEIPFLGNIKNLHGNLNLTQEQISSSNIEGTINNSQAKLIFTLNDFKSPTLDLKAELNPLNLQLLCCLKENTLNIKNLSATYNNIQLDAKGKLEDIQNNPTIDFLASITLDLEDLSKLPLEIKKSLTELNPTGLINAQIRTQGPINNLKDFNADIKLNSKEISILNYIINDIALEAHLDKGKAIIEKFEILFLESLIKTQANIDFINKNFPYELNLQTNNMLLDEIIKTANLKQEILGAVDMQLLIKGNASDLNKISLQIQSSLKNLKYDNFLLPSVITAKGDFMINNLKDVLVKQISINDNIISLTASGTISNIYSPELNLVTDLECALENINLYSFITMPSDLNLNGKVRINSQIKGQATKPENVQISVKVNSDQISVNQFSVQKFSLDAILKEMNLIISSVFAKLYNGELSADAALDLNKKEKPEFKFNAYLSNMDMQNFARNTKAIPLDLEGILSSEIIIKGAGLDPQTLNTNATITANLENGRMKNISLDKVHFSTNAEYNKGSINLKEFALFYKTIEARASGKIASVLNNPLLDLAIDTDLNLADLNKLPLDFKKTLDELNLSGQINTQIKVVGSLSDWTATDITAKLISDQIGIKNVIFEDIDLTGNLGNKILNLRANSNAYDGNIKANAKADFLPENFIYQGTVQIENVNIGRLVEESKIIEQKHKGILSFQTELKGIGQSLNTLQGKANIQMVEGELSGLEILNSIGKLAKIDFLSNFTVSEAHGTYNIQNSTITTEDTELIGPDATVLTKGTIYFNQNIDLNSRITLSSTAAHQIPDDILESGFIFENNIYYTEMDIGGTITSPQPNYSKFFQKALKHRLQQAVQEKAQKELKGLFEDALKGIFK